MPGTLTLLNLIGSEAIEFATFPTQIQTEDGTNWDEIDVASHTKPLVYANRNPQQVTIDDLLLDGKLSNQSVESQIEQLRDLMKEGDNGMPPPLQVLTEGWSQRVVLKDMRVTREFFKESGAVTRARVSLTLLELQSRERVTVNVVEDFPIGDNPFGTGTVVGGPTPGPQP